MRIMLRSFRIVAVCCLLLTLCTPGFGQKNQPRRGKINVPFEFYMGGVRFPPGQYILELVSSSSGSLRSVDGKTQQPLYFMEKGPPAKTPMVIFGKRFNRYYLAAVWAWFGWLQFTGFSPHEDDPTKIVPIIPIE